MSDERGQTTILVLGLALVCFAVAGVAIDGTRAFLLRRTLQNDADSAALAGAGCLDTAVYYESGGDRITLDPDCARRTAYTWIGRRRIAVHAAVEADEREVAVLLRGQVPTTFLRLAGIDSLPVAVEARSLPISRSP